MQIDNSHDRSEFIKAEIEKRLVPGFFQVRVDKFSPDYQIVITDGFDYAGQNFGFYHLDTPHVDSLLDAITKDLVASYAILRFVLQID